MELPPNYQWEERESRSVPGHTLHRLRPALNNKFAIILYHRREGKWLYIMPFGETFREKVNTHKDWSEMPSSISSLEEAKAYVETLWRLA